MTKQVGNWARCYVHVLYMSDLYKLVLIQLFLRKVNTQVNSMMRIKLGMRTWIEHQKTRNLKAHHQLQSPLTVKGET